MTMPISFFWGIMQQLQQKSDENTQPEEEETHPPNRSAKRRGDRNLPEANVPKSRKVAEPHAPGSSLLADTTTFLGDGIIAIVKRTATLPGFWEKTFGFWLLSFVLLLFFSQTDRLWLWCDFFFVQSQSWESLVVVSHGESPRRLLGQGSSCSFLLCALSLP